MARRAGGRQRGGQEDWQEDPGYRQRRPRRSGGNEGLWIALGAALILGVVLLLILTGGESEEETQESARAALEQLFGYCMDGNVAEGIQMVEASEILRVHTPEIAKNWATYSEEKQMEYRQQAFGMIRRLVLPNRDAKGRILRGNDLGIQNKSEIPALFLNATYRVHEAGKRVDIRFERNTYPWTAILRRSNTGWILSSLVAPN